jgi:hypothetical protein
MCDEEFDDVGEVDDLIALCSQMRRQGASELWIAAVAKAAGSENPVALANAVKRLGDPLPERRRRQRSVRPF